MALTSLVSKKTERDASRDPERAVESDKETRVMERPEIQERRVRYTSVRETGECGRSTVSLVSVVAAAVV